MHQVSQTRLKLSFSPKWRGDKTEKKHGARRGKWDDKIAAGLATNLDG